MGAEPDATQDAHGGEGESVALAQMKKFDVLRAFFDQLDFKSEGIIDKEELSVALRGLTLSPGEFDEVCCETLDMILASILPENLDFHQEDASRGNDQVKKVRYVARKEVPNFGSS